MPTTYAHDLFGKRVYHRLDRETQKKIKEHQALFQIGVHGPDILFYYKPFKKNPVSSLGSRMHLDKATAFFAEGRKRYLETKDDAILVYLLGFVCHFILDSNCHPYIGEYVNAGKATHEEVETDFDRYLMEKTEMDPFSYKPGEAIHPSKSAAKTIAKVIDGVSEKEILQGLKGIRLYTGVTVGNAAYRGLLLKVSELIGCYTFVQGRVMRSEHLVSCEESNAFLAERYEYAVKEAVQVIEEFVSTLDDPENISERFDRNYE